MIGILTSNEKGQYNGTEALQDFIEYINKEYPARHPQHREKQELVAWAKKLIVERIQQLEKMAHVALISDMFTVSQELHGVCRSDNKNSCR